MTIELKLNETGRSLLMAAHGRLHASLIITKSSPSPRQKKTKKVRLVQRKAKKRNP